MTEQVNREVAVLNAALELRPAERAAYLDQACAGHAALRKQVEALLDAHERRRVLWRQRSQVSALREQWE